MSLLDSLLGQGTAQNLLGTPYASQTVSQYNSAIYNSAMQSRYYPQTQGLWVFNGKTCSLVEFADLVFGDTPQKTVFILKYSDTTTKDVK